LGSSSSIFFTDRGLVDRAPGYVIEDEGTSSSSEDEDEEDDVESPEEVASSATATENTDIQWKQWMDDVSTQKAGASHEDKPA
jgi:Ran GTPase-activating protein (RanGAP) involved in mRNA processing and transport